MRPKKLEGDHVTRFTLPGGTNENDLYVEQVKSDHGMTFESIWLPTVEEMEALSQGAGVRLLIWGLGHPPVALGVEGVEV